MVPAQKYLICCFAKFLINSLFCYLNLDPKPGQGPSKLEELEKITEEDEMNFEYHNLLY